MPHEFVQQVSRDLESLNPPSSMLVAVSGGADSVALLNALHAGRRRKALRNVELVVGHVDHRLRADSSIDAELVEGHARRLGLTFASEALELGSLTNLEERARDARYEALARLARRHGCAAIATGHSLTDQAETLLWRLARGSGSRGLGGMRPERPVDELRLLRPMLGCLREEARAYCAAEDLSFRDDPTNDDDRPRARLRAEVLPVLERLSPGAIRQLAAAAERLRADDDLLSSMAKPPDGRYTRPWLRSLPSALQVRALVAWFEAETGSSRRLTANHLGALGHLISSGAGEVDLPASSMTRRVGLLDGDRLRIEERAVGTGGGSRIRRQGG